MDAVCRPSMPPLSPQDIVVLTELVEAYQHALTQLSADCYWRPGLTRAYGALARDLGLSPLWLARAPQEPDSLSAERREPDLDPAR